MGQPIQPGRGEQGSAEPLRPFGRGPMAGEQEAALFVALVEDLLEVFRPRRRQRVQPEVLQDEQRGPARPGEPPIERALGPAPGQMPEQVLRVRARHLEALATGGVAPGLCEMRLPRAGRATEQLRGHDARQPERREGGQQGMREGQGSPPGRWPTRAVARKCPRRSRMSIRSVLLCALGSSRELGVFLGRIPADHALRHSLLSGSG